MTMRRRITDAGGRVREPVVIAAIIRLGHDPAGGFAFFWSAAFLRRFVLLAFL